MQNQTMTALLVAINSKNGRTFNSLQLAEMYGVEDNKFRHYAWSKGWLSVCNHSDYFSAEDAAFIIYQIGESRVRWENKEAIRDIFESEPFAKLYARTESGDNSLSARFEAKAKRANDLEQEVAEHTESIVHLNNEVKIAKIERDQIRAELDFATVELDSTTSKLNSTVIELDSTTSKLNSTVIELNSTTTKLDSTTARLDSTITELRTAKTERDQMKSELRLVTKKANILENKANILENKANMLEKFNTELTADNIEIKSKISQMVDLVSNVYQAVKENAQNFIDRNTNGSVKKIFTNGLNTITEPMDTTIEALKQLK